MAKYTFSEGLQADFIHNRYVSDSNSSTGIIAIAMSSTRLVYIKLALLYHGDAERGISGTSLAVTE
jgi:hypothetical protein